MTAALLKGMIRLYQMVLSPIVGGACRFDPSCSAYAFEAVDKYGAWRGGSLAIKRVLRCHPLGPAGYDPVPELEEGEHGRGR